jgi:hypothetical protein
VSISVVQWGKSLGKEGVLCTIITRRYIDHIRIIAHMDISFIVLLYTRFSFYFVVSFVDHIRIIVHMDISFIIWIYSRLSFYFVLSFIRLLDLFRTKPLLVIFP